ncbi:MAG TPA: 30S ribosomal protein S6 [Planctomycetota bacterium]|nr:30S ribosomal protein S6 [Planctomycetota bacterium]OQC18736.1 MAG: 30S ribosomal protein S6 [Planctomycetes bacterium ADurb.Bin069]NMD36041.1 30S ribosomal protein S6 [Planctomycetota bacterium]HNR99714.1 30S ribosomal protein S6 [Planctomycetota bacterium]HNU25333.1 30S ribosomal protein S6 [Planctomycetota bacterium]
MNVYEGMFVVDPADAAGDWEGLKQHIFQLVERLGGEIAHSERWPDRKLAYDLKGRRKGTHFLMYFKLDGSKIAELRREAQLSDRLLRVLIIQRNGMEGPLERFKEAAARSATPVLDDAAGKRLSDIDDDDFPRRGRRGSSATPPAPAPAAAPPPAEADAVGNADREHGAEESPTEAAGAPED